MLKPKFVLSSDRIYIDQDYLCNGHWLIPRTTLSLHTCPKVLKGLASLRLGLYHNGIKSDVDTNSKMPAWSQFIPAKSPTARRLSNEPTGVIWVKGTESKAARHIIGYKFNLLPNTSDEKEVEIGVCVNYLDLLDLGVAHAENPASPIRVTLGDKDGELAAVVMPMRG